MSLDAKEALEYHWALDSAAAEVLAEQIETRGYTDRLAEAYEALKPNALEKRDHNRRIRAGIYTGDLAMLMFDGGACSLGNERGEPVEYEPLFDFVDELRLTFPNMAVGVRGNAAKPRTGEDWPGIHFSLDPNVRKQVFDFYTKALNRGIAIVTEITQESQLGMYAPFLSGYWLGARDMQSTTLRGAASAYHLPVGIKNSPSGDPKVVRAAINTVRSNSEDRKGTGVKLSGIAGTHEFEGLTSGILPVRVGNQQVAIIARGHEVHERSLKDERREQAFQHLGAMCSLGVEMGAAVILDGSHDVPKMFDLSNLADGQKNPDRLVPVLHEIIDGILEGKITDTYQIAGVIGEIGPDRGDTDPNFALDAEHVEQLHNVLGRLETLTK